MTRLFSDECAQPCDCWHYRFQQIGCFRIYTPIVRMHRAGMREGEDEALVYADCSPKDRLLDRLHSIKSPSYVRPHRLPFDNHHRWLQKLQRGPKVFVAIAAHGRGRLAALAALGGVCRTEQIVDQGKAVQQVYVTAICQRHKLARVISTQPFVKEQPQHIGNPFHVLCAGAVTRFGDKALLRGSVGNGGAAISHGRMFATGARFLSNNHDTQGPTLDGQIVVRPRRVELAFTVASIGIRVGSFASRTVATEKALLMQHIVAVVIRQRRGALICLLWVSSNAHSYTAEFDNVQVKTGQK